MNYVNDPMKDFYEATLQMQNRFTAIALRSLEEMLKVQTQAVSSALVDGAQQARALAEVKNMPDLEQHKLKMAQPDLEKMTSYLKSACEVAAGTQTQINKLIGELVADFNTRVVAIVNPTTLMPGAADSEVAMAAFKSVTSSANSVCDNMAIMTRQLFEMTHRNAEIATGQDRARNTDRRDRVQGA
jgi:phasin family protein